LSAGVGRSCTVSLKLVLCRFKDKVLCARYVISCELDTGWANACRRPTVEQAKGLCESSGLRLATVGGGKCTGRFPNTSQQISNNPAPLRPHRKKSPPVVATGGDYQIECCTGNEVPCESSSLLVGQWSVAVGWVRQLSQDLSVKLLVDPVDAAVTKT